MANHVGPTVSRLICERAYRAGDLKRLSRKEMDAKGTLRAAIAELRSVRREKLLVTARITEIDEAICVRAVLNIDQIRSIHSTPRTGPFRHGEFTAELVRLLKEAERPLPTSAIIQSMVVSFGLPYDTPTDREATRRRVVERLRVIARRGAIQRLHATDRNIEGLWRWTGI